MKITHAMELIAASQISRARGRIAGSAPYVQGIEQVLQQTAHDASGSSRLIGEPEAVEHAMVVAIVADRGLCGAYNSGVLRATERIVTARQREGAEPTLVTVGRKAIAYFRFRGRPVVSSFSQMSDRPSFENAREVAAAIVGPFLAGEVDVVDLVSTRYRSAGNQEVETRRVLPLPAASETAESESDPAGAQGTGAQGTGAQGYYDFEPAPEELLRLLVPRYAEAVIFRALLEASASEHTARQRAMAAATENAEELITTYRRRMNRARQDAITTEIMEIVGGAEALRQAAVSGADVESVLRATIEEQSA